MKKQVIIYLVIVMVMVGLQPAYGQTVDWDAEEFGFSDPGDGEEAYFPDFDTDEDGGETEEDEDEEEIHEDVLDYSKKSEYWYNGVRVEPDKNGFVICDGALIGYEGTKTKLTIPSGVTKIYGLFNSASRKQDYEVKIPKSVLEISDSFNTRVMKITFEKRDANELKIGKNCFNDLRVERIDLPEGTVSIGTKCFRGISFVAVPSTVKKIDAWKQYGGKPCIICKKGSYAQYYAKEEKKNYSNHFEPYVDKPRKTIYATVGKWLDIEYEDMGFGGSVQCKCRDSSVLKVKKHNYFANVPNLKVYGKKPGRSAVILSAGGYSSTFEIVVLAHTQDNVIKQILHNSTTDSMSKVQKAYHIGEYLGDFVTYDMECLATGKYSHKYSPHTAQGALLDKMAVCDGISYAYQILLKEVGIESRIVTGNNGGPHAWNLVKIGKKWSHVDVTNGVYFKTDKQMEQYCWWNKSNYPKADYKVPKADYKVPKGFKK